MIFGSTGSVGRSALDVIEKDPANFKVIGLCANQDVKTLGLQVKKFKPDFVCLKDDKKVGQLKALLPKKTKLFKGETGLDEFASISSDISLMAISGIDCLRPLLINIASAKRIALANKESIVTAADLVFKKAKRFKTEIIPVDSEINALFQLMSVKNSSRSSENFRKIYLTASGGALASHSKKSLDKISVDQVLKHPTWKMGPRITVDSATLVNKAFEVIETHAFFGFPYEAIDIVIHKESIVHALVEFSDNSLFACIYPPDMKMPITHSLYYPGRFQTSKNSNFKSSFSYSFSPISYKKYPLLELVLTAAKRKDNSLVILNACDEVAIDYFLNKKIKFTDIHKAFRYIFKKYPPNKIKTINDVFYWDNWARAKTKSYLEKIS